MADIEKYMALTDCHKCSSSFLSIVKFQPLKIPGSVLEKVEADSMGGSPGELSEEPVT